MFRNASTCDPSANNFRSAILLPNTFLATLKANFISFVVFHYGTKNSLKRTQGQKHLNLISAHNHTYVVWNRCHKNWDEVHQHPIGSRIVKHDLCRWQGNYCASRMWTLAEKIGERFIMKHCETSFCFFLARFLDHSLSQLKNFSPKIILLHTL